MTFNASTYNADFELKEKRTVFHMSIHIPGLTFERCPTLVTPTEKDTNQETFEKLLYYKNYNNIYYQTLKMSLQLHQFKSTFNDIYYQNDKTQAEYTMLALRSQNSEHLGKSMIIMKFKCYIML